MIRMNMGTRMAPLSQNDTVSSSSVADLLMTRIFQLRDALSNVRSSISSNTNDISGLRTTADKLVIASHEHSANISSAVDKINEHTTSISEILEQLKTLGAFDVTAREGELVDAINDNSSDIITLNDEVIELKSLVDALPKPTDHTADISELNKAVNDICEAMETLPQPVDYSGDIDGLNEAVKTSNIELNRISKTMEGMRLAVGRVPEIASEQTSQLEKLEALSDDIVYVNERVNGVESSLKTTTLASASENTSYNSLFIKASPVCSTVLMVFAPKGSYPGGTYSGSGCFITQSDSDLKYGLFLTCAHNVISKVDNTVQTVQEAYIENPISQEWLRVTPDKVFVDGVGDIALIKTDISFVGSEFKPLRLANEQAKTGDRCIVIGDPAMMDSDSMSCGVVRSARYEMKPIAYQINECLHTDAPTIGGSSGSPMLNENGEIIAMLTYGHEGTSTFGGGPNVNSIKKSLRVLSKFRNNIEKKYLGLVWGVVYPTTLMRLKGIQPSLKMTTGGVKLYRVNTLSPFYNILFPGDIITEIDTYDKAGRHKGLFKIGVRDKEVPLGFLLYEYDVAKVKVTYISGRDGSANQKTVNLSKTYADVAHIYDVPLSTGLKAPLEETPVSE